MTELTPSQAAAIIGNSEVVRLTPTKMEELKKDLFIALEMLNGYTEEQAIKNWECENGQCQCP
jgi:hypothetical protein